MHLKQYLEKILENFSILEPAMFRGYFCPGEGNMEFMVGMKTRGLLEQISYTQLSVLTCQCLE